MIPATPNPRMLNTTAATTVITLAKRLIRIAAPYRSKALCVLTQTLSIARTSMSTLAILSPRRHAARRPVAEPTRWSTASGTSIHEMSANAPPSRRLMPSMLRTARSNSSGSPWLLALAMYWMLASPKPDAMMLPVFSAAVITIQMPYCATPRCFSNVGAERTMATGYAA